MRGDPETFLSRGHREFLRERAAADFLRSDYNKGSADHLDKAAGFYPSIPPPAFDVPPLTLDPDTRRPSSTTHMLSQSTASAPPPSTNTLPSHNSLPPGHAHSQLPPTSTTSTMVGGGVNHPNVTQQSQQHQDEYDKHHSKADHDRKATKGE